MSVLTDRECERLLTAVRTHRTAWGNRDRNGMRDESIVRLMLEAGLRCQEVCDLEAEHVCVGAVRLQGRTVKLADDLAEKLLFLAGRANGGRVFKLSHQAVGNLIHKYAREAGIVRPIKPSTLRRTFANRVFPSQVPTLKDLARILGLGSAITASRYLDHDIVGAA